MNILVDEQIPLLSDCLRNVANVFTFSGRNLTKKQLLETHCEILFVRSTTKVNKELLEGTKVKFVGSATSGIDHVDVEYLKQNEIFFVDAKGSNANSVAEYVVFSILHWAFLKNINTTGLKVGIIGFGNIGSLVGLYAHLLGMNILVNDPPLFELYNSGKENPFPSFAKYCELESILQQADVITNHVPLTKNGKYPTYYMFDEKKLDLINEGTLFIHTSRGGVVEEKAILNKFKGKDITLSIDVWENEPRVNLELVKKCEISTPHIAGYSFDGKLRGTLKMLQEFEKFSKIQPDYSIINKEISKYKPLERIHFTNPKGIYTKLLENRKLLEDTLKFKQLLKMTDPLERSKYFDELRKTYPKRRETL